MVKMRVDTCVVLVFVFSVCFFGSGCTNSQVVRIEEKPSFFVKKKECSELIGKIKAEIEKQETEKIRGNSYREYTVLDHVCYVKDLDTCIGVYDSSIWDEDGISGERIEYVDELTKERLYQASYVKDKKDSKSDSERSGAYLLGRLEAANKYKCVE